MANQGGAEGEDGGGGAEEVFPCPGVGYLDDDYGEWIFTVNIQNPYNSITFP